MIVALPGHVSYLFFILRGDLFYVLPCVIWFLCFTVLLALQLPRLGKRERLGAFRAFVRFAFVWFCLFPLPLGVSEGLRCVLVALPELFFCPFLVSRRTHLQFSGIIGN